MNIIDSIIKSRHYLLDQIKDLSIDQLNTIPPLYSNNILWNLGHMIAAQQGICYLRPGATPVIDMAFFHQYKPGSKPEGAEDSQKFEFIKELMDSTMVQLQKDTDNQLIKEYKPWTTRYNVEIKGIDDAIAFLLFHEGYHSGVILSLKKLVS